MEKRSWYMHSSNNMGNIYCSLYRDESKDSRAIIQIIHGMGGSSKTYKDLANLLAREGYIVIMQDLEGHGKSSNIPGHFGDNNAWNNMLLDIRHLNRQALKWFPDLPIYLLGHSMGSLLARSYIVEFPDEIEAVLLSGTLGYGSYINKAILFTKSEMLIKGKRGYSEKLMKILNKKLLENISDPVNPLAFLSTDKNYCEKRAASGEGTMLTLSSILTVLYALKKLRPSKWAKNVPNIPIYIFSGGADPFGEYGVGPASVYAYLHLTGHTMVDMKLYPGKRHEMLSETNKDEVLASMISWLKKISK